MEVKTSMHHIRLRTEDIPENEISCPVGGTVNPKEVCGNCAWRTKCGNYKSSLREKNEK